MYDLVKDKFAKIGAEIKFYDPKYRQTVPCVMDVTTDSNGKETFKMFVDDTKLLDIQVLETLPDERHLVVMVKAKGARDGLFDKSHYLCGHDERHWFVAQVGHVSTVSGAKASLKPAAILQAEVGLPEHKRHKRVNSAWKRQGEWFFVPVDNLVTDPNFIFKDEPLRRGRSKPHVAQYLYRFGGTTVYVNNQHPNGISKTEYEAYMKNIDPSEKASWKHQFRIMVRDASVFVKGYIKHSDHATITLMDWHRVHMNTEKFSERVAFLD